MTLKIATCLAFLMAAAQAAPMGGQCPGSACSQSASSGDVQISSSTNIVPITEVTPITRYQPIVLANAPIVQSECYGGAPGGFGGGLGGFGGGLGGLGGGGLGGPGVGGLGGSGMGPLDAGMGLSGSRFGRAARFGYNLGRLSKRSSSRDTKKEGRLLFSQFQSSAPSTECAPTDATCIANLAQQTVGLGSSVSAIPSTNVLPSTTYQPQVQSLDSNIQAAPAQMSSLSQQVVNLGSNTVIQPTTQVLPQTSYQPTVNQLATSIQAASVQDQSLPQSSVQLGSSVNIAPSVTVSPLTTFQPSISSLPFVINVEPCVSSEGLGKGMAGGQGAGFQGIRRPEAGMFEQQQQQQQLQRPDFGMQQGGIQAPCPSAEQQQQQQQQQGPPCPSAEQQQLQRPEVGMTLPAHAGGAHPRA